MLDPTVAMPARDRSSEEDGGYAPLRAVASPIQVASKSGASRAEIPQPDELQAWFPSLEILDLLGAGGMGAVYKVRQPRLNRFVALKILTCRPDHVTNFALRFEREARLMARLNHAHIVTIHDFGEIDRSSVGRDTLFYFLMELVDGSDLNRLIHSGALGQELALALVPQICDALQFAHDAGITHRDIKPANILVDAKGNVKVADFGLARLIRGDETLAMGLTTAGTVMGTPHYIAPEQLENPEAVDHRADIYSLGVVVYELLTGRRPTGAFDPPSKVCPVDRRTDRIVLRAMEKEPARRYQQASEMKRDVIKVMGTESGLLAHRRRRLGIGLTAALVAAGIGGWVFKERGADGDKGGEVAVDGTNLGGPVDPSSENGASLPVPDELEDLPPGRLRCVAIRGDAAPAWLSDAIASNPSDFIALAAFSNPSPTGETGSEDFLLMIRADGTVVACAPTPHTLRDHGVVEWCGQIRGAKSAVATGDGVAVLLDSGKILSKGVPNWSVPTDAALQGPFTHIAGGLQHVIALRSDGTVLGWGDNRSGQVTPPPGLDRVARITCGHLFTAAWTRDGQIVTWGLSGMKQIQAPAEAEGDILGVAATRNGIHVLKLGGKLVTWGWRPGGKPWPEFTAPPEATGIVAGTDELAIRTAEGDWTIWSGISEAIATPFDLGDALRGCRNPVFVGGQILVIEPIAEQGISAGSRDKVASFSPPPSST